jgi:gliding motility-associated-like protein
MSNRYLPLISKHFAVAFLLMSVSFFAKAQTDYSIGTGTLGNTTTTYPCPIQDYFEGSRAQYLWIASELSAAGMGPGMINSIKFNIVNLNTYSGTIQSYQIKIGGTSVASLGTTTWENVPTTVFGPVDYVATAGINTFTLSSPFFWNGTDNIIIEICNGLAGNETDGITHYTVNPTIPWTTGLSFNGSHTYRADNVGNSCGTTVTTNTGTQTTRPNITFNQTPASACSGTPTAGTANSSNTNILCLGTPFTLSLSGATIASGLTYQWQSSPDNMTWTNIAGGTSQSFSTSQMATTMFYRCVVTCTNGGASSNSSSVQVNSVSNPPYVSLPYTESFESNWLDACNTRDVPNTYWKNTPATGNNAWRRDDDGTSAAWTTVNGGYTPTASSGSRSARFHSFNAAVNTAGTLDLYINCNTTSANKRLDFDFINTNGTDTLSILLSTDGGTTFVRLDSVGTAAAWRTKTIYFSTISATAVLRFRGVSDDGTTDIGLDNINLRTWADCSGVPTGGTATGSPLNVCAGQTINLSATGVTTGPGITYQWQVSTNGGTTWNNIAGATNFTAATTQVVTSRYRLVVTCTLTGGGSANSTEVTITSPPLPVGTYTINKNNPTTWPGAGAASNFNSFAAAYAAVSCGIAGAVTFEVAPGTGPYTEQLIVNGIVGGSSATNTITFKGNGNTIAFAPTNTNERAVIKLKNTKFFIFDSLTVQATGGTFGFGVHITGNADSNVVRNCTINTITTGTSTDFAGVVISGADNNAIGTGTTTALNDGNRIHNNTITGGAYGVTLTATFAGGANGFNQITNNTIRDFYQYGIFVSGSYNTVIEGNSISRPTRTPVTDFFGIHFTTQSNTASIARNKIFNPFGAATNSTAAFYGINFTTSSASAGNENVVVNNMIRGNNGNGIQHGLSNTGSSNVWYFHNTISLDSTTSNSTAVTRGFSQTTAAGGIFFYNNLISITRGGTGVKHAIYLNNNNVTGDNNNYFISNAATNHIGYFGGANRTTLAAWRTATGQDAAANTINPVFANPSQNNLTPNNAAIDNKGLYLGIDFDINNAVRSTTTPDVGAWEFTPPPCSTPPVVGTVIMSPTVLCQNSNVSFSLNIGAYGSAQTFQWQYATTVAGPWSNVGPASLSYDTTIAADRTYFYRCAISCLSTTSYSDTVLLTVNPALPTGNYTIDFNNPTTYTGPATGTNFKTFAAVKAVLGCGVTGTGNVVFNVVPNSGPYNEQFVLDSVVGVNPTRKMIFNGNGNTIAFSSSNNTERAVIKLNGADHIVFDSLVIDANGPNAYGYGIQLINNADSNIVRKSTILSSTTNTGQNFAGIVINSAATNAISTGNTWCDANEFDNNIIRGGYFGITLMGGSTANQIINNNRFTNNKIEDFYFYGFYSGGTANTLIEGNIFTRPTRTIINQANGIYLSSGPSNSIVITRNRFTKFFAGAPTSTVGFYGIYHNNVDATSGNEMTISNNAFYNLDGAGFVYPLYNNSSNGVNYYHNTISIDNPGSTSISSVAGLYQTGAANSINFKNNIVTITRGGTGSKHALYFASGASSQITSNWNDFYIDAGGTNNFIGFYTANRSTLPAWRAATLQDTTSLNFDPLYTDSTVGNLAPKMLPMDNKGINNLNVAVDINNATRSVATPDMGAWEFTAPGCIAPPVAGTATVTPNSGVCLEVPITLNLTGNTPPGQITFQWQSAPSAAGPWTNMSGILFTPQYDTLSSTNNFYRCAVTCNNSTVFSTVVSVTLNNILLAGTYTIDATQPQTWPGPPGTNFQTVQSAVNALLCGMTGSVVFNVKGTYNEQIRIPYVPGMSTSRTVTFQSWNGNPADAVLTFASTAAGSNYTLKLDSTNYFTFRNMTFNATNNTFGRVVELANTAGNDSLVSCIINTPVSTTNANSNAAVFVSSIRGSNIILKGNTINNGSNGIYFFGTNATLLANPGHLIDGNTVNNPYTTGINVQFANRIKITNNTVNLSGTLFTNTSGIYTNYADTAVVIAKNTVNINNVITGPTYGIFVQNTRSNKVDSSLIHANTIIANTGNTNTVYGLTVTNSKGLSVLNNAAAINASGATAYGMFIQNNVDSINIYNNTVQVTANAANGYSGYFVQGASSRINVFNNIFSNKGTGRALYVSNPANFKADYNMLYSNGTNLVQVATGTPTNFTTYKAWRDAWNWDKNSISFEPALTSATNLRPDIANPDSWAINGRGLQIKGNVFDFNNNYRPDSLTAGVPDLGAFEFYPTALPTVMTATPAAPGANVTQTFSYGTDTVMKIKWGTTFPPSISVRRFSGDVPQGLVQPRPDSMFFYTKVDIPGGGNYDYDAQLFYIDNWLGSVDLPSQLGLGKTTPGNAWVVGFTSRNELPKRRIYQSNVNYLDRFTGLINPYAPPILPDRDSSNRGRRFYFAYAKNQLNASATQQMVVYLSAGEQDANVQVRVNGTPWVRNYLVPANTVTVSEFLPKAGADNAYLNDPGIFDRSVEVISDVPIVAYAHAIGSTSSGASMLLPVGTWGYEYKTLCITNGTNFSDARPYFYVIADNDNTVIQITPSTAVQNAGFTAGVPTTVTLNKGQVIQLVASAVATDISGSLVKAVANSAGKCFPVAVFSGTSRTNITISGCTSGADFMMQQNFPITAWGRRYLTAPTSFSTAAFNTVANPFATNIYRVAVQDPTTVVRRNGVVLTGLVNNHYYQFQTNLAEFIEADKPIMVAQFTGGGTCVSGTGVGDPEMFYISPIEQGIDNVAFYRNTEESITINYLTMIVPTNGLPSLQIYDGPALIAPDYTYSHPNNGNPALRGVNYTVVIKRWTSAQQQVRVVCDSNFTGITYGLGSVESYGYNMGTLVKNLRAGGSVTNTLNPSNTPIEYTCANAPFKFTMSLAVIPTSITWKFSQVPNLTPSTDVTIANPVPTDSAIINGDKIYLFSLPNNYVFSAPGLYSVPVTFTAPTIGSCDNSQTDIIFVQVIPAPAVGFATSFVPCVGNTATFTADAATPGGVNVSTWNWTFNNGSTATGATTNFTYNTAGTFTEKLSVITADGCIADSSRQVVVNPLPTIAVVSDSLAVCNNASATFTIQNPVTGTTYNWYSTATGTTPVATGTSYTITNVLASAEYFIEAVSSAGCTSASRRRVKVQLLPGLTPAVVTITAQAANSVTFSWAAVPGAASYQVSVNGGALGNPSSGATGTTHTVSGLGVLQNATIQVQAVGLIPCQNSLSATVSGCANSAAAVVPDSVAICINSNVTLTVQPTNAGITYNWFNVPSGGTSLFTGSSYALTNVTASAVYYVQQSNTATGCVGSVRTRVVVNALAPLVKPVVTVPNNQLTPTSITFVWNAVPGATGYQVSTNNGTTWSTPSSGATGLSHTVSGLTPNTSVTLIVRAVGIIACQNSISDPVTGKTLIDQIYVPSAFNPNSTVAQNRTLRVYGYVIQSMQFAIFNQWGEKVFETTSQTNGWDGSYKGKPQPSGVYIYVLKMTLLNGTNSEMKGSINLIR